VVGAVVVRGLDVAARARGEGATVYADTDATGPVEAAPPTFVGTGLESTEVGTRPESSKAGSALASSSGASPPAESSAAPRGLNGASPRLAREATHDAAVHGIIERNPYD
jgi:hypothetical protein